MLLERVRGGRALGQLANSNFFRSCEGRPEDFNLHHARFTEYAFLGGPVLPLPSSSAVKSTEFRAPRRESPPPHSGAPAALQARECGVDNASSTSSLLLPTLHQRSHALRRIAVFANRARTMFMKHLKKKSAPRILRGVEERNLHL